MEPKDWVIVLATIIGPVAAVCITLWRDRRSRRYDRELDILRALMRSRGMPLSIDYVSALNQIEIEFHGKQRIQQAFSTLIEKYNYIPNTEDQYKAWQNDEINKRINLIRKISEHLGMPFDSGELVKNTYVPQAWNDAELEQAQLRRAMLKLLKQEAALQVIPIEKQSNSDSTGIGSTQAA